MIRNLIESARGRSARRPLRAATARTETRRYRPHLETLEDRSLMAIGITLTPVTGLTGLTNPILATNAGDNSDRLFVVEQSGRILVREPNGTVSVFLDISAAASNPAHRRVQAGGEQGLLGLAFHPDFENNGLFYVHHTRAGLINTNDVVEYRVSATDPNVANPASERLLLRMPQPFGNHNGGSIAFGPNDGLLYIGKGDGGGGDDPNNNAQNFNTLLGKILRIDVDRDDFPGDATRNYGIPPDNVYVGNPGLDEIFSIGFRNPYRFSFDRDTGLLYVGDVGQDTREEIDTVTGGTNYGWRPFEGSIANPSGGSTQFPGEVAALRNIAINPITDLPRSLAQSITGGYVYRGTAGSLPVGSYLFGDFITGMIFLYQDGVRTTLLDTSHNISSFGEDEDGELYVVAYGGTVFQVDSSSSNLPPALTPIADRTIPSSQDTLTVTLSATDPNSDSITYAATTRSLALEIDTQLGLRTDSGNLWQNWGGRNEKWLLGRGTDWYFLLPNGELYRYDQSGQATGTLIADVGDTYHASIDLLYNAQLAHDLDLNRGLQTNAGNLWENWGGRGERWLLGRNGEWYFILPNGQFFLYDNSGAATGILLANLGSRYHTNIRLLYEGDQGQALATVQVNGANLTVNRDDGFIASLIVTAIAGDVELTDREEFQVNVT
jgi:glucose/arabinose dehydrogenase